MQTTPAPKLLRPDRSTGILLMPAHLDAFVEESHPVRTIWAFVERLDLGVFLAKVKSVEGEAGRSAIDPRLLLALWLYAAIDGVDSGRRLARLCKESFPYRWLCGGVEVEYHKLNDFRSKHVTELRTVLGKAITALVAEGLISLETIALDGVRIRASAGSASFRRGATLKELKRAVDKRITDLLEAWEHDGTDPNAPKPKRVKRQLEEKAARIERAIKAAGELDAARGEELKSPKGVKAKRRKQLERQLAQGSRASTTDPDARVLHMPDGGFRPAFVGHVATDGEHGFVVGAYVTSEGTDNGQIPKMLKTLNDMYEDAPVRRILADSGFRNVADFPSLAEKDIRVYTPVPPAKKGTDRFAPRRSDDHHTAEWRARMGTEDGARLYRRRSQLVEFVFANFRNRGLRQFRVRGPSACEAVVLLHSLAHNALLANLLHWRKAA